MSDQEHPSAFASVKKWMAGHPVAAYLLMLYPIEWIVFIPVLLGKSGFGVISVDIPYEVPLAILAPVLLALPFLMTRLADGKAGTRDLRRRYYHFRVAPQWYVAAIFGPPLVLLAAGLVTHGSAVLSPITANIAKVPTVYLLALVPTVLIANLWEEGAWAAFMTSRLQKRLGPVWASLLVAPAFGFVHIPLFFVVGGLTTTGRLSLSQFPLYVFLLLIAFSAQVRILITWLFNSTGGSVPVAALFHGAIDITASTAVLGTFFPSLGDGNVLYIALAVVAVAVIAVTRGRLGYRPAQAERHAGPSLAAAAMAPAGRS
jgi:membrane protease YdiL (CAAX protease family)